MASTTAGRLVAVFFAVLALAATQARASQLNFYSKAGCSGNFLRSCFDFSCCQVPAGAASYEFHYVPGFPALLYGDAGCGGNSNGRFDTEVRCTNGVGFKSAYLSNNQHSLLNNVATE